MIPGVLIFGCSHNEGIQPFCAVQAGRFAGAAGMVETAALQPAGALRTPTKDGLDPRLKAQRAASATGEARPGAGAYFGPAPTYLICYLPNIPCLVLV